MTHASENRTINTVGEYLRGRFGGKTVKLSIDGGFTCPNRDGAKGKGGCAFCSEHGSGELSSDIPGQIKLLSGKWPDVSRYIAYFQSYTSTYAPAEELRQKYRAALGHKNVVGLAIATRPDCLPPDVLSLLAELKEQTFLWMELGLQTINEMTAQAMNRCYPLKVYDEATEKLSALDIPVVTHLILGLPGESRKDMFDSVKYVCGRKPFGLKLHLLNVVKGSPMEKLYPGYTPFGSPGEYIGLVCDLLETIPSEVTMHRLTGDVPRRLLIAPEWSYKKRTILNGISNEMKRRGSYQGCRCR